MPCHLRNLFLLLCTASAVSAAKLDFNRDIRPILSDNCTQCHGPDAKNRKAKLRLDLRDDAVGEHDWGRAVVPGHPEKSILIERIESKDPDERMPPPESHLSLNVRQISQLRQWISEGAEYDIHWAFKLPVTAEQPVLPDPLQHWPRNGIDHFVAERLQREGLMPSPEADKRDLVRRVTLDLTGLPPTPGEVANFLADPSPQAYENLVDRLLAAPAYGENMAFNWLDAARYADTDGYQSDKPRTMWPWRDWVIRAYNSNMPFDQFTIEQLAGDMLPEPTIQQQVATGFNRNHRLNNEGGALPEEFIVEYVADRAETTGAVWLGLTFGCARCHDHKYDPIKQREYFELFAYFNRVPESGKAAGTNAPPMLAVPADPNDPAIQQAQSAVTAAQAQLAQAELALPKAQEAWEKRVLQPLQWQDIAVETSENGTTLNLSPASATAISLTPATAAGDKSLQFSIQPRDGKTARGRYLRVQHQASAPRYLSLAEVQIFSGNENIARTGKATQSSTGYGGTAERAIDGNTSGDFGKGSITHTIEEVRPWWEVDLGEGKTINRVVLWNRTEGDLFSRTDGVQLDLLDENRQSVWHGTIDKATAKPHEFTLGSGRTIEIIASQPLDDGRAYALAQPAAAKAGEALVLTAGGGALATGTRIRYTTDPLAGAVLAIPEPLRTALAAAPGNRTAAETKQLKETYRNFDPEIKAATVALTAAKARQSAVEAQKTVKMLVMQDMAKPRPTYRLERGQYDKPDKSEELQPGIPASLAAEGVAQPKDRLELARWLMSEKNPLTARVAVNRYWHRYFGTGLVKTMENFGTQGEWPSHPALLDWLAVHFRESGWDVKAMQKLIVTSATYRQSSRTTAELAERDPDNRLLTRGPRLRLPGQVLRDQALAVSGLLQNKIGGPPVNPYQPDGLWSSVAGGKGERYVQSKGDSLYRRSLYTYWKRTVSPPMMTIFDSPGRETCNVRTGVTNTPLQALTTLNDVSFVEAARKLAARMMTEGGDSPESRIRFGYELATGDVITPNASMLLAGSVHRYHDYYQTHPEMASSLLSNGDSPLDKGLPPAEHAAYLAVANTILNLDATLTKE